jgi:diamine N-acetyltransferase
MSQVELKEITRDTLQAILKLEVNPAQKDFVAPNAVSLAEALFEPNAWYRAIYADDEPVGFLMLFADQERGFYYLWRFMISAPFQGKEYGAEAIRLLVAHVKTLPKAKELKLSYVPADGGPEQFYLKQGFENTGEVEDGEHIMQMIF